MFLELTVVQDLNNLLLKTKLLFKPELDIYMFMVNQPREVYFFQNLIMKKLKRIFGKFDRQMAALNNSQRLFVFCFDELGNYGSLAV